MGFKRVSREQPCLRLRAEDDAVQAIIDQAAAVEILNLWMEQTV